MMYRSTMAYSKAETAAIKSSISGKVVYICDFHREWVWERCVKDHKPGQMQMLSLIFGPLHDKDALKDHFWTAEEEGPVHL